MFGFLCSVDEKTPHLALGAVKNISLNISISNLGDDAYDANVSFNVSRELFFINMWQKVRSRFPSELLADVFRSTDGAMSLQTSFLHKSLELLEIGFHPGLRRLLVQPSSSHKYIPWRISILCPAPSLSSEQLQLLAPLYTCSIELQFCVSGC